MAASPSERSTAAASAPGASPQASPQGPAQVNTQHGTNEHTAAAVTPDSGTVQRGMVEIAVGVQANNGGYKSTVKEHVRGVLWPIIKFIDRNDNSPTMVKVKKYFKNKALSDMSDDEFERLWQFGTPTCRALRGMLHETMRLNRAYVLQQCKAAYISKFSVLWQVFLPRHHYSVS